MAKFKVGSKVRVKGQRRIAFIATFYSDIDGGVRLDREILGFRSWNIADLRALPTKTKVRRA